MAVNGDLQDIPLTTLISVNCNERNTSRLRIWHGGREAVVFFNDGQIAHMEWGDKQGEEVIYELLTWDRGRFELEMNIDSPASTISIPWSNLVLEGMRLIDEGAVNEELVLEWEEAPETPENPISQSKEVTDMANLQELLRQLAGDVPGFISADVVGMDGLSVAGYAASPDFDAEAAAAQLALVMKLVQKTAGQLKAGEVEDNLVTTGSSYILTRYLGDNSYFLSVAVNKEAGSLGNMRMMTRQYTDDVWNAIPKRTRR